jgi:hypothetical protein
MLEWTFNREDYLKNPRKWIQHYMQLHDEEVKNKKQSIAKRLFKWMR